MIRLKSQHRIRRQARKWRGFLCQNISLLVLLMLMIGGAFFGALIFQSLSEDDRLVITDLLYSPALPTDIISACSAVVTSGFCHFLILVLLFLCGMTAFGCPLILLSLIFFGFRIGVIECQSYLAIGWLDTVIYVHIPILIAGIAVLLAVKHSLHMSCVFSRQLLPSGAHCGGMWIEFKRYLLYYVVCFLLIVASAVTEVLLQVVKTMM